MEDYRKNRTVPADVGQPSPDPYVGQPSPDPYVGNESGGESAQPEKKS